MSGKIKEFVTVFHSGRGWKAVLVAVDDGHGYEPVQTGMGDYETETEAEQEARDWAEQENVPFIKRGDPVP